MLPTSRIQSVCVLLGLLLTCRLEASEIWGNVTNFTWSLPNGPVVTEGAGFTANDTNSLVSNTNSPNGVMGWTNNSAPAQDLSLFPGQPGNVSFNYRVNTSEPANSSLSVFTNQSLTNFTSITNTSLWSPPPPSSFSQYYSPFLPVIFTPSIGILTVSPFALGPDAMVDPEPATALLLISGMAAFWVWRRKRAQA